MSSSRELFGGAITLNLPRTLIDASDLRQVPDTQEVFLYPESSTSIIVEVLERVAPDDATEAAKFHFDSLAHDNDATAKTVLNVDVRTTHQGETPPPVVLHGIQAVPKFNSTTSDEVFIHLALYRIASKNVDLVMTMNIPVRTSDDGAVNEEHRATAEHEFDAAVSSLNIVDFGLFA
ncbi:Mog1p/PsbP-like protein [Trametopsis cervina]|nr:Mog1p/PsbP-like protein [Trametopsis cervina]